MISVIIPYLNSKSSLKKSLHSLNLGNQKHEIIIVDDASTQPLKFKRKNLKIIRHSTNKGRSAARNSGILNSKGEYLLFLDSDVMLGKKSLNEMLKYTSYDIVYPAIYSGKQMIYPILKEEKEYPHLTGCFLMKKSKLGDIRFDENLKRLEDYDFFINCKNMGLTAKYAPNAFAYHLPVDKDYEKLVYEEIYSLIIGMRKRMNSKDMYNPFNFLSLIKVLVSIMLKFDWTSFKYDRKRKIKLFNISSAKLSCGRYAMLRSYFKGLAEGLFAKPVH
jgi:glycosyltransferase involved in cell wall biosynthesis